MLIFTELSAFAGTQLVIRDSVAPPLMISCVSRQYERFGSWTHNRYASKSPTVTNHVGHKPQACC